MELLSSCLVNDGEDESVSTRVRNEDALTYQDDPQIDVDEKFEELDKSMTLSSEEEFDDLELDDKERNVTHYEEIDGDEKVEEPKQSMKFSSEDKVSNYYRMYSKQVGFGVIRRCVKKDRNGLGNKYMVLTCIRQGSNQSSNSKSSKPTATITRTGCKARICASKCIDGMWYLGKVVLEHNHCLSPGKARFFKSNKILSSDAKKRLEYNDIAGIRANKNLNSLVVEMGGFEKVPFEEKDCRNFINKSRELRLGKGGAQALCDYFKRMQEQNDGFYYVMDMDDDSRLRNVFWADARSRAAYECFGDAITFDTTYLTNRYGMPFAPFVGVNHHGQSMLFGAGLISSEDTDTFAWLFDSWLSCMNGRAPRAIITDQDRAMKNAIARVFPNTTRHRFCLWHIMRKLPEKFAAHAHFDGINSALRTCLYDSQTCDEFEDNWKILLERYQLQDNAWLQGLYSERTFWVPAYMKDIFWAGMNTTQRSESMNSFFDGYVHSQTTLKEFVDQFDSALRKMVEKEARADFDCFNRTIQCISPFPLEKQFQDVYTNAKFKEVQEQFNKQIGCNNSHLSTEGAISTYQVIESSIVAGSTVVKKTFHVFYNEDEDEVEVKCTCALFETRGILCSHCISILLTNKCDITLPPRYVLDRWRKDIKRRYTSISSSSDKQIDNPNAQRREKMRKNFEEVISLTEESVEHYMEVMKNVDMLKEKFRVLRRKPSHLSHHTSVVMASSSCNDVVQSNDVLTVQSKTVLTPVKVKHKGRPRIRRLVSAVEKAPKKKKQLEKETMVGKANKKVSQKRSKSSSDNNTKQIRRKTQTSKATQDITFAEGEDTILAEGLPGLLSQRKYEVAFLAALQRRDISRVSWICSQVDLRQILSEVPIPLSQGTLLNILWYLAYDINNNPSQKLAWMTEVANTIIPTDPMIAVHVRPIFGHIYAILNKIRSLPTSTVAELSSIDQLIHAITLQ